MTSCTRARTLCAALTITGALLAGQTRTWQSSDFGDFEKGTLKGVSLRSDGRLSLAPRFIERLDSSSAYLWALVRDSKGNLYAGGGPQAKLYRIPPKGESKVVAEFDALEIHALAVDRQDRVYVASAPDGKVFRMAGDGKPEPFYDPKAKYIWAMAFSKSGDLFVATGDQGEIHKVTPDGKGSVFFRTDEAHARSLAVDSAGNLIVGTDPGGLVIRVSPAAEGFVLHQMSKREVTAVALAPDGSIYAAAVGGKPGAVQAPAPPPSTPPPAAQNTTSAAGPASRAVPASLTTPATVSGGSEIVRIYPDGYPRRVWSHAQDLVYALASDNQGRMLAGTGNKGQIYRIESDLLYTALINATPTQVTGLCPGPDGVLYAATGNSGKVFQIGPGIEKEGTLESEVFDAGLFSTWGRLDFTSEDNGGGKVSVTTRSGNLDRPQKNWSEWSPAITGDPGARITSPPARFLQWKAKLETAPDGKSPWLHQVEAAYLGKNVPPQVEQIEITPANYRFPAVTLAVPQSRTLNLPPIGKSGRTATPSSDAASTPAMIYAKGYLGARWIAGDDNGDTLSFTIQIRGVKETEWKLVKENHRERYLSWDTSSYADGEYRLRVIASDAPSNPKEDAQSEKLDSYSFLIDNTPPKINGLSAARAGAKLAVKWSAADALNVISKAEYSVDGGEWLTAAPKGKISDSLSLDYDLSLEAPAGERTIAVRVQDEFDNVATEKIVVR